MAFGCDHDVSRWHKECDRLAIMPSHRNRVTMEEIARQHERCGAIQVVRFVETEIVRKYLDQVRPALGDVVFEQFNAVNAHKAEKGVMRLLKLGFSKLGFDGSKFSLQNANQKIATPAGRFQKTRVNSVRLVFDEVEHGVDQPWRREHFAMVGNSFL